jgi:hypothetical protein
VIYQWAGKDGSKTYNEYHAATLIEKELSPSDKKGDFDTSTITDTWLDAQKVETTSEPDPNEKPPLSSIINLDDFEKAFAKSGSQKANAYVSGASNELLPMTRTLFLGCKAYCHKYNGMLLRHENLSLHDEIIINNMKLFLINLAVLCSTHRRNMNAARLEVC